MKGATSLSRLWAFLLCNCCLHSVQLTIVLGTGLSIGELSGHHLSLQWLSIVGSDCGFGLSIVGSNCHHKWLKALLWEGTLKFQLGLMARNISTCVTVFEELSSNCFTVLNWAAGWMTTCVTRIDQKNEWQRESSLRALTVTSFSAHLQVKHLDVLCTMCTVHICLSVSTCTLCTFAKASFSSLVISWFSEYSSCLCRVVTSRRLWGVDFFKNHFKLLICFIQKWSYRRKPKAGSWTGGRSLGFVLTPRRRSRWLLRAAAGLLRQGCLWLLFPPFPSNRSAHPEVVFMDIFRFDNIWMEIIQYI